MAKATCSIAGCVKPAYGRGWCAVHWRRWKKHGDPNYIRPPRRCEIDDGGTCGGKVYGYGMCNKHYSRWHRYGDPLGFARRPTLEERFWPKVDKRGPDECWPWQATITPAGYGQIGVGTDHLEYAHRVSYRLLVGPIPDGLELDHLCHTDDLSCPGGDTCPHRRCVNPAHLEPVTGLINGMRSRSPHAINARKTQCDHGHEYTPENTYTNPSGLRSCRTCSREQKAERYHKARIGRPPRVFKISDADAADIRQRWNAGTATRTILAKEYDVSFKYVSQIIQNERRSA